MWKGLRQKPPGTVVISVRLSKTSNLGKPDLRIFSRAFYIRNSRVELMTEARSAPAAMARMSGSLTRYPKGRV